MSKAPKKTKRAKAKYAKGWETRRKNAEAREAANYAASVSAEIGRKGFEAMTAGAQALGTVRSEAVNEMRATRGQTDMARVTRPGGSDIVGADNEQLADHLIKLASTKGGKDEILALLVGIQGTARYEGQREVDAGATKRLVEVQNNLADRVICAFIAEVDHAIKLHRGLPPDQVWNVPSFTVTKIVDALNKAGYTAKGKTH